MSRFSNFVLGFSLLSLCGCAALTDHHYEKSQRARAHHAWKKHGAVCKNHVCERDYAAGWKDGFYDVATGGKGCPPVVAPCRYWCPDQILVDHDTRRLAYYDGFQDGATCALEYPQTHYLKVWSSCECPSPQCEERCEPCIPCGVASPNSKGLLFEGAEFLIEDDQFDSEARPQEAIDKRSRQPLEPIGTPRGELQLDDSLPRDSSPKVDANGLPIFKLMETGPPPVDDYGLMAP